MVLLRRVIGDALRARRQSQHRTLREVSTSANVSLGYLSEIERGQKEASSELLSSICDALGAQLSQLLREVSDTLELAEQMDDVLVPVGAETPVAPRSVSSAHPETARQRGVKAAPAVPAKGEVAVAVHRTGPLTTTLRSTLAGRQAASERDVVCVG
jgi:transcriptional regulator with XRE-family HTH domain